MKYSRTTTTDSNMDKFYEHNGKDAKKKIRCQIYKLCDSIYIVLKKQIKLMY